MTCRRTISGSRSANTFLPCPAPWAGMRFLGMMMIGKNGCPIWESYVAGLDPENPDSRLTVKIAMIGGKPVVTWEPALNGKNADGTCVREGVRLYQLKGSTNLKDWSPVPDGREGEFNFFRVGVSQPGL